MRIVYVVAVLALLVGLLKYVFVFDILNGFSSTTHLPEWQVQLALAGFCVSPMVGKINGIVETDHNDNYEFAKTGGINEGDYEKASIYAILYSLYSFLGRVHSESTGNQTYEFTFNTWGVAPSDVGEEDPQRHGMTSYGYFGRSEDLLQYVNKNDGKVQIVEIGCGTGAGANHLSRNVFPKSKYMGIDMQKAAINTCNRLHASDRLQCVHIPSGVGNDDGAVPLADGTADIVIILETHIAEIRIGPEEKAIFAEVLRILKPGGYFLWGNALPTGVWHTAEKYLAEAGMTTINRWNNTKGAVLARDEDAPRVAEYMDAIKHRGMAFGLPHFGDACFGTVDKLVRNFYRDPGTALYDKMVRGTHSYMHYVFRNSL